MLFDHAHAFDEHALLGRKHFKHFAAGTFEIPGNHFHLVALADVQLDAVHKTSGASETIFMKLRSRNSRATGPKMRVPRGLRSLSMITIALLSKRRTEPSSRLIG